MKKLPVNASDEATKEAVRQWVSLLAEEKYADALDMLSPEVLPCNGSVSEHDAAQWTPELIEAVISNYDLPEPLEGEDHRYKVVPIVIPGDASMQEAFEKELLVRCRCFSEFGQNYIGIVHVDLPLAYEEYDALSDLTARFYLRPINDEEMVLVLLDIHVM